MAERQLLLIEAGACAVTRFACHGRAGEKTVIAQRARQGSFPFVTVFSVAERFGKKRQRIFRRRGQHIDDAVNGVGAVKRARRPAHNFNAAGDFVMRVEEPVDIGEAGRSYGDAVFKKEKRTGAGARGQNRRADRGQVFGARSAMQADARRAGEDFRNMVGVDECQRLGVDNADALCGFIKRPFAAFRGDDDPVRRRQWRRSR